MNSIIVSSTDPGCSYQSLVGLYIACVKFSHASTIGVFDVNHWNVTALP